MSESELLELKRTLAPSILAIEGVSGIGVGQGVLNVYIAGDEAQVRKQVDKLSGGAPLRFIVSGGFSAG